MVWSKVEIQPRFYEVDSYQIVNNMYYLAWCDIGRFNIAKTAGLIIPRFYEEGIMFVVSEANIQYKKSVHFWDTVKVETIIIPTGSSKLQFKHKIKLVNGNMEAARAESATICIRNGQLIPALPEWVHEKIENYVTDVQKGRGL
jgi:YbgC/YbaW family acyl-CoA thioester hydrolase